MPAESKSQQRLMAAALHGADFAMARNLRKNMSLKQLADYAKTPTKGKPEHVRKNNP